MIAIGGRSAAVVAGVGTSLSRGLSVGIEPPSSSSSLKQGFLSFSDSGSVNTRTSLSSKGLFRIKAMEGSRTVTVNETDFNTTNGHAGNLGIFFLSIYFGFWYWALWGFQFVACLVAGKVVGKRGSFSTS